MSLVSICIPAFHAAQYLPETLLSIRAQTFTDWELIVTEDGSADGTERLVDAFREQGAQSVRYLRHAENRGLSATRSTCIRDAFAATVALLDADDYWAPTHLQDLMEVLSRGDVEIAHSGCVLFDHATGRHLERRAPGREASADFLNALYAHRYIIQPSSVAVRRAIFERIGYFDPAFRICDDMEFWFRAARAGVRFAYTGRESCFYRKHASSLSARGAETVAETAQVYKKHLDWEVRPRAERRMTAAASFSNAGRMFFRKSPGRSATNFFESWKLRPSRVQELAFAGAAWARSLMQPAG
ncbi:MAG: hypothetical protein QOE70_6458 [Chthoniobacter sp.]|jgi:glycosyltransferase involved in cell wall biosynthesis|nr:hypothetical protein [Chthoniobacter sp.]